MGFPKNWPADCPPLDAKDAEGTVYRIAKSNPPLAAELATHHEMGRAVGAPACLRCGLSVFRDFADAVHSRRLFPKLGGFIASANLRPEHGKTKITVGRFPTHTTWWS